MEIYSLRVKKEHVGRDIPFDRVYLVKHEDRSVIEKLFRSALVMPIDEKLAAMLYAVKIDEYVERPHNRKKDDVQPPARPDELKQRLSEGHWLLVLPILPKWLRANKERLELNEKALVEHQAPAYLSSPKWESKRGPNDKGFLGALAYLQVPGKKIRPVCVACPRMIQHQAGECKVGDKDCYTHLSLGLSDYFTEGLNAPVAEEVTSGELF